MKRYGFTVVIASLLSMTLLAAPKLAADQKASNEDCLMCHGEKSMTTKRGGRTVSLYLDQKRFTGSVHGSLSCTNCHADLDGSLQSQYQSPYANVTWTFIRDGHSREAGTITDTERRALPVRPCPVISMPTSSRLLCATSSDC